MKEPEPLETTSCPPDSAPRALRTARNHFRPSRLLSSQTAQDCSKPRPAHQTQLPDRSASLVGTFPTAQNRSGVAVCVCVCCVHGERDHEGDESEKPLCYQCLLSWHNVFELAPRGASTRWA